MVYYFAFGSNMNIERLETARLNPRDYEFMKSRVGAWTIIECVLTKPHPSDRRRRNQYPSRTRRGRIRHAESSGSKSA